MGFSKNPLLDPKIQDGGDPPSRNRHVGRVGSGPQILDASATLCEA